ncbi:FAD-binding oxidoreductase [Corallococcus exiguus]|uniref:FAD-binding oxidoreductase n=2 Tax=Corallococcus TaxID=83461 RepID=UPI000EA05F3C|nr:FAD-binding oxidoreductase [Corallococcus exiguus]RKH16151.1 FAD-binding oxidoreductase [Corallococcus sp. CA041A]RUO87614.1 FAD-binding oxidoreductase [Corallococcus sp. AB018]
MSETEAKAPTHPGDLRAALAAWREAVGEAHVILDTEALEAAETATFATTQRIPAIVRPADTAQVQACLRIASEHRVPVYPVSAGRNWGYGSRVPPGDGSVLLDLGRMNRILAHDEQLAYLTVEPGVTFRQAYEYLRDKGSSTFITTIGGSPDASMVGNALERGDGAGPNADIFQHVCALEAVLPTGERVETGHARFPGARSAPVFRWGLGPVLDGLFSQSSLGVVTRMTFWLARKQPWLRDFFCAVNDDAQLWDMVDRLQALALDGTLKGSFFFWNDIKAYSITQQFPYPSVGRAPLPDWAREKLREGFGRWAISGTLIAPDAEMGALLEKRLARAVEGAFRPLSFGPVAPFGEGTLQGVPTETNLAMAYWRKRTPKPEDPHPDRDRCGFIWCSVAVPFTGPEAKRATDIADRVPRLFGFEPNLALLAHSPRCVYLVTALAYDRDVRGEDARAQACYRALSRELADAGYHLTRAGLQAQDAAPPVRDDSAEVRKRLKAAFDPEGILAPGRSEP